MICCIQSFSIHDMNVGTHVMFSSLNSFLETHGILNVSISFSLNFSAFKIFLLQCKIDSNIFNRVNFIYYIFSSLNFKCCVVYVLPTLYLGDFINSFIPIGTRKQYTIYIQRQKLVIRISICRKMNEKITWHCYLFCQNISSCGTMLIK